MSTCIMHYGSSKLGGAARIYREQNGGLTARTRIARTNNEHGREIDVPAVVSFGIGARILHGGLSGIDDSDRTGRIFTMENDLL